MTTATTELLKRSVTVEIADAKISSDPNKVLATYSLGSCIGVCLYSNTDQTGCMLHFLLPDSAANPQRAKENPYLYADTGMRILLNELAARGINKNQIKVKIAGGAQKLKSFSDEFDIGKRNYLAIRKFLWKNGMFLESEDVGGSSSRTLFMDIYDGSVMVKSGGSERTL